MDNKIKLEGVPLGYWVKTNPVKDSMIFKESYKKQIDFVKHDLSIFFRYQGEDHIHVISDHTSKSIKLPVYLCDAIEIKFVLRNNFYNWKLSVISPEPLNINFDGLFMTDPPIDKEYTGDPLHPVYFEGFPEDLIFGYYQGSDKKRWSAEIQNNYLLWTTIFLVMRGAGIVVPQRWAKKST